VVVILGQILPIGWISGKVLGAESITTYRVPAVIGLSAKDAKAALQAAGLVPKFQIGKPAGSTNQPSTVYAVEPAPGTRLNKDAVVVVTLYAAAPTGAAGTATAGARPTAIPSGSVRVPSVIGRSAKDAKVVIVAAGLVPKFQVGSSAPSPAAALTVHTQLPEPGATTALGSAVTVTLYSRIGAAAQTSTAGVAPVEVTEVRSTPFVDLTEEVIDPRSGRLYLSATDVVVPAGAITLEVRRQLLPLPASPGLLGTRWRTNWESRLQRVGSLAVVEADGQQLSFRWDEAAKKLVSPSGDYLLPDANGRTIWVKTRERVSDTFDQLGRLVERDVRNGNKVALSYDSKGRLAKISGPHETWLELHTDESGRLVEIKSSMGHVVHYGFSTGSKAPAASRDADSPALRYAYHQNGTLERIEHPQLGATNFAYDPTGRVVRRTWADGSGEQYDYDDAQHTLRYTDPSGQVTTTVWSADRRVAKIISPLGHHSMMEYDQAGRLVALTGPTQQTTRFTFDSLGRTISVENSSQGTTQFQYVGDTELVSSLSGPGENRQQMEYDPQGNLIRLTSFPDQTKNVTFEYASDGQVAAIIPGNGQKQTFTYNSAGQRDSVTDAAGNTWRYEYDVQGNLIRTIDPLGAATQQTYDAQGRVASITSPDGATTRYVYEQRGRLFQITTTDELGRATRAVYDQRGRLTNETDAANRTTRYGYDASGRLISMTDPAGQTYQYEYDSLGNLIGEINPLGGAVKRTYDVTGKVASVVDPVGTATRFEYSPSGALTKFIDAAGVTTTYSYDNSGQLIDTTSAASQTTQYEYAAAGRVSRMIPPSGPIISYEYDTFGNLAALRKGDKIVAMYEYDALGRRVKERQVGGLEITYRYDAVGNLVSWQDNQGGHESMKYDAVGQTIATTDATGATTSYQYDPAGNVLGTTDPLGKVKRGAYNIAGELVEITEPNGDQVQYEYDPAGRLAAVQHPGGGKSLFAYDGLGNPLKIVGPLGDEVRSTYDPAGRVLSTTDAKGQTTSFEYDQAGRLSAKRLASGTVVKYQYDRQDNTTSVDDGKFPIRYAYDDAGNLIRVEYPAIKRSLVYEYNAAGLNTKFIDSEGRTVLYEYDDDDRLTTIKFDNQQSITFAYDPKGRVTTATYPNGVHGAWKYDANDRVTELIYQDAAKKTIAGWAYTYDAAGNCIQTVKHDGQAIRYAYDPSGQLVEEKSGEGEAVKYGYGAGGNRASYQRNGQTTKYRYDEGDRLLSAGNETFAYDANGNLIERKSTQGVTRYEYDVEDQLVKVVLPDRSEISYGYAPTGERIWRRDSKGMTWFVTDGVDLIAELDQNLKPQATYLHGSRVDQPLIMVRGGQQYYFHADRLGSIHSLTDARGNVSASYDYDAFGQIQSKQGPVVNPFTYTARELDAATGLFYYRARYYDAQLGRFLGTDSAPANVGDALALHPFIYARNNPVRFNDSSGLAPKEPNWDNPNVGRPTDRIQEDYQDWGKRTRELSQGKEPYYEGEWTQKHKDMGQMREELTRRGAEVPKVQPQRAGTRKVPVLEDAPKGTLKVPVANVPSRPPGNLLGGGVSVPVPPTKFQKIKNWAGDLIKPAAKWLGEKTVKMIPLVGAGLALSDVAQAAPEDRPHEIAKAIGGEAPGPLGIPGEAIAGWLVPPGTKGPTGWVDLPPVPGSPAEKQAPRIDLDPVPNGVADVEPKQSTGWDDLPPATPAEIQDTLDSLATDNADGSSAGGLDDATRDRARALAADADARDRAEDLDRQLSQDERRRRAAGARQGGNHGQGGSGPSGEEILIDIINQAIQESGQHEQGQQHHP
jgi:RHS repeat-associated protein